MKGSSTRQKLQNSKGYTESPEFLPALGLIIFGKKSCTHTYIYTDTNPITLPCSLEHTGKNGGGLQHKANYHVIKKIHNFILELCTMIQQILNCSTFLALFNAVASSYMKQIPP